MADESSAGLMIAFPKVLGISQILAIIFALFAGYKVILDLQVTDRQILDAMVSKEKYYTLIKDLGDKEHARLQREIDKISK